MKTLDYLPGTTDALVIAIGVQFIKRDKSVSDMSEQLLRPTIILIISILCWETQQIIESDSSRERQ